MKLLTSVMGTSTELSAVPLCSPNVQLQAMELRKEVGCRILRLGANLK